MLLDYNGNKGGRLLSIYERLDKGELINKEALANDFGVSQKTIQLLQLQCYHNKGRSSGSIYGMYRR